MNETTSPPSDSDSEKNGLRSISGIRITLTPSPGTKLYEDTFTDGLACQQVLEAVDGAQRRPQVVAGDVGELIELAVFGA